MEKQLYIPVEKSGKIYVQNESYSLDDYDIFGFERFNSVIERYFKPEKSVVKLDTGRFLTKVFKPITDKYNINFCLVDKSFHPVNSKKLNIKDDYKEYLFNTLINNCKYSEGIVPNQSIRIESNFVTPRIKLKNSKKEYFFSKEIFKDNCIILGSPGAGKTTLLRKLTIELAQSSVLDDESVSNIPIYIQLRDFRASRLDFYAFLNNQIHNALQSEEISSDVFDSGKLLLLLDGVDELEYSVFINFIDLINDYIERNPLTTFIITSRPNSQFDKLENFKIYELLNLDNNQIRELCYRKLPQNGWRKYVSILKTSSETFDFLRNPLMLTISHFLFLNKSIIPSNTAQLLKELVEILINTWDISRNVKREYLAYKTNSVQVLNFFSKIALYCRHKSITHFSSQEIYPIMDDFKSNNDFDDYLDFLELSTGIIAKEKEKLWSFSHKSLIDFFCSLNLVEGVKSIDDQVFIDKSWRRISSIISGLSSDPDYIIYDIYNKAENKNENIINQLAVLNESLILKEKHIIETVNRLDKYFLEIEDDQTEDATTHLKKINIHFNDSNDINNTLSILRELIKIRFTLYENTFYRCLTSTNSQSLRRLKGLFHSEGNINVNVKGNNLELYISDESPEIE